MVLVVVALVMHTGGNMWLCPEKTPRMMECCCCCVGGGGGDTEVGMRAKADTFNTGGVTTRAAAVVSTDTYHPFDWAIILLLFWILQITKIIIKIVLMKW